MIWLVVDILKVEILKVEIPKVEILKDNIPDKDSHLSLQSSTPDSRLISRHGMLYLPHIQFSRLDKSNFLEPLGRTLTLWYMIASNLYISRSRTFNIYQPYILAFCPSSNLINKNYIRRSEVTKLLFGQAQLVISSPPGDRSGYSTNLSMEQSMKMTTQTFSTPFRALLQCCSTVVSHIYTKVLSSL